MAGESAGQAVSAENVKVITEYGRKFEQVLNVVGPNGTAGRITIAWQVDHGSRVLRLITAVPEPFK